MMSRTRGCEGAVSIKGLVSSIPTKALAPSGLLTIVRRAWRMSRVVPSELLHASATTLADSCYCRARISTCAILPAPELVRGRRDPDCI